MPSKMKWSNTDLGEVAGGVTRQTFASYVEKLEKEKKFKKESPGRPFLKKDVEKLAKLLGFDIKDAIELWYRKEKEKLKKSKG